MSINNPELKYSPKFPQRHSDFTVNFGPDDSLKLWSILGLNPSSLDGYSSHYSEVIKPGSKLFFLEGGITVLTNPREASGQLENTGRFDETFVLTQQEMPRLKTQLVVIPGQVMERDGTSLGNVFEGARKQYFSQPKMPRVNLSPEDPVMKSVKRKWSQLILNLAESELAEQALLTAGKLVYLNHIIPEYLTEEKIQEKAFASNLSRLLGERLTLSSRLAEIEEQFSKELDALSEQFVQRRQGVIPTGDEGNEGRWITKLQKTAAPALIGITALSGIAGFTQKNDTRVINIQTARSDNPAHHFYLPADFTPNHPPSSSVNSITENADKVNSPKRLLVSALLDRGLIAKGTVEVEAEAIPLGEEMVKLVYSTIKNLEQILSSSQEVKTSDLEAALKQLNLTLLKNPNLAPQSLNLLLSGIIILPVDNKKKLALIGSVLMLSGCVGVSPAPIPVTETADSQAPLTTKDVEDELKKWQEKTEGINYGQNLTFTVEKGKFAVDPTIAYPATGNQDGYVKEPQFRFASNKVSETKDGGNATERTYRWIVVRDANGTRSYVLKELSQTEDERSGVNNTRVYALAEQKDGHVEEIKGKLVVEGRATEREPSLNLEISGLRISLVEVVQNGNGAAPTPTAPVSLIEKILAEAAEPVQAAEQPTATSTRLPSPTPPATSTKQPTPTNTPKPTVTELPTPTPEVWEGDLTQSEINSFAAQIPCSPSDCIKESFFSHTRGHTWGVTAISSGKLKEIDIIDAITGNKVGMVTVIQLVTKDANGNGKIIYKPIQGSTVDNPEYNLFAIGLGDDATNMGEPGINFNPIYDMMPMDFLARVYKKNTVLKIMFMIDDYDINYDNLELFNIKLRDQNYKSQLQSFWQDSGVNTDNKNPLMLFSRSITILSK